MFDRRHFQDYPSSFRVSAIYGFCWFPWLLLLWLILMSKAVINSKVTVVLNHNLYVILLFSKELGLIPGSSLFYQGVKVTKNKGFAGVNLTVMLSFATFSS